ncbi:MAG: choice-of-anchor D domain-containing protein [Deltaproteobacteria bacterium]|nr:choice-of-anchor D domain-containing protein [Deltaproteobacteria bacterium]MBI3293905.1 choice-of-anchor D domain-containing protein [Deltaproteobacteria bacterium]
MTSGEKTSKFPEVHLNKTLRFSLLILTLFSTTCSVRKTTPGGTPQSGAVPQILMLTGPTAVNAGECTPFVLKTADLAGTERSTPLAVTALLSTGFYNDSLCQTAVLQTVITPGTSTAPLYYTTTAPGGVLMSATDSTGKLATARLNVTVLPVVTVTISDGPTYNFGSTYVGMTLEKTFTVSNTGYSPATALAPGGTALTTPFAFKGGTYPGTGGSCADTLASKTNCTLVVTCTPTSLGQFTQNLSLSFYDGSKTNTVTRSITGSGVSAGSIDPTFGNSGKVLTSTANAEDRAFAVIVDPDGKIVVAGSSLSNSTGYDTILARFNADGSLDSSFGAGGVQLQPLLTTEDRALAIVRQSDGKYVTAGYGYVGGAYQYLIARFNSTGLLDTSFGTNGKTAFAVGSGQDYAFALAQQSDGKFVVGGYSYVSATSRYNMAVARFNSDGTVDSSFLGGKVTASPGSGSSYCYGVAVQSDDKIVAVGYASGTFSDIALVRFNSDGSLDNSFGDSGSKLVDVNSSIDYGYAIQIQSDGRIVAIGTSSFGGGSSFAAIRLTTGGTLDGTFNFTGKTFVQVGPSLNDGRAVAIQSNGRIIIAGYAYNGLDYDFALTRLFSDGSVDTSFGTSGKFTLPIGVANDRIFGLALDSSGKIIVTGDSYQGNKLNIALIKVLP